MGGLREYGDAFADRWNQRVNQITNLGNVVSDHLSENHYSLTVGIDGTLGGNPLLVAPGLFGGGGVSVTVTSDLQVGIVFSGNIQGGLGIYGGVGIEGGIGKSSSTLPFFSSSVTNSVEANIGFGPAAGFSSQFGDGGASFGRSSRVGVGYGLNASGGKQRNTIIASPPLINWGD